MASPVSDSYTVTSAQARKAILAAFKVKRPVFLWGPPGIGKSEVVEEITNELGGYMIDLRMAQMEPTDIRGIPFFNRDNGKMDWAPPIDLPDAELASQYPIVVLFLDEMNSAAPSVQAAGYQLILNRRVGKYVLPDNVVIVAAGNRESDKGVTYRMPMPLANRFIHVEMRPDFNSWQDWAVDKSIHKDVVGYLSFAKQDLYDFDSKSASKAFATPRSWSFVSDLLSDESLDEETLFTLVAGAVGEGLAAKFKTHRKFVGKMPQPADILSGKVTDLAVKEISAMYALTTGMCYELRDAKNSKDVSKDQLTEMMGHFLAFMMTNFETELVIMGSKIAIKTYEIPIDTTKLKNFNEFYQKYGKFIRDAAVK
jgi:hypothetical protein